jgi:hypothetical protein
MTLFRRTTAALAAATSLAGPVALATSAHAAPLPLGQLSAARAALHGWTCDRIADEKFPCSNDAGAGFSVNLRPISDLPKWQQEDPDQIAYATRRWFVTVQPNDLLSDADLAAVKRAVARHR